MCERLKENNYQITPGAAEEVKVHTPILSGKIEIIIPRTAYLQIYPSDSIFSDEFWRAHEAILAYGKGQQTRLGLLRKSWQWRIDHARGEGRAHKTFLTLAARFADEQIKALNGVCGLLAKADRCGQLTDIELSALQEAARGVPGFASYSVATNQLSTYPETLLSLHDKGMKD